MTELGKIEGRYREKFDACNSQERRQLLGYKKWAERAGSDIDRIIRLGKAFLSQP